MHPMSLQECGRSECVVSLKDRSKLALVRKSFGRVLSRTVLYRGENADLSSGICYRNVNDYLKGL